MDIFVDASYCQKTKRAGMGIHPQGISTGIKAKDSLTAELMAVITGVYFCVSPSDIVYTDCLSIVKAVVAKRQLVRHEQLCIELFDLLGIKKGVKVKWVRREKNREADALARRARKLSE